MTTGDRDTQRLRPIAVALAHLAGNVAAFRDLVLRRRAADDPLFEGLLVPLHGMNQLVERQLLEEHDGVPAGTLQIYVAATLRAVLALADGATDEAEVLAARDIGRAAEDLIAVAERNADSAAGSIQNA